MREILYGLQFLAWLLVLVFTAQFLFAGDNRIEMQALELLPFAIPAALSLALCTWMFERNRHAEESEVQLDRLRRKHPQLFRQAKENA
ncbi:MAG: hypothetical protein EOP11_22645 [Proteobacteria bacterium]|nr:MAG: hypothetical protein EOP11_22645 [Pseudomonadota bacterium]